MKISLFSSLLLVSLTAGALADWPQWRGPNRDGIALDAQLPDAWTDELQPVKLWESEEIPSDRYGGHGSVSIAGGKVYASIVWHRDEPTEKREIDNRVMSQLDYRNIKDLSPELIEKMEEARMNRNPRLRGSALDEWAESWVDENLDEKTKLKLGGWIIGRFKQGKTAVPISDYELIEAKQGHVFENQAALEEWVSAQPWNDPATAGKVLAAVPNTELAANDVVLCLSLETGETLWRFEAPGEPAGRTASATPAIANGKVFAVLSEYIYAIDAESGKEIWRTPTGTKRGIAGSPQVVEGKVLLQKGYMFALDAATGELLWEQPEVRMSHSSPAVWNDVVIVNAAKELVGLDLETGEVKWRHDAGGVGSPVVQGDHVVVVSDTEGKSLSAFRLSIEGAKPVWAKSWSSRRYHSTPIVHNDHVYHLGSGRHLCVDLASGETKWDVERSSNISSPILADGKLLVFENNGGFLAMVDTAPGEYALLGRAKVGGLGCTTPAISGSKLVVRTKDSIVCYDLMGQGNAE